MSHLRPNLARRRRSLLLLLSPLGLMLLAAALAAPKCALAAGTVIEGEAAVVVEDDEDHAVTRYLIYAEGRRFELDFATASTGQSIMVEGRLHGDRLAVEALAIDTDQALQGTGALLLSPPSASRRSW